MAWCGALCGGLLFGTVNAQTAVDTFEYASSDELLAAWTPSGNAVVALSDSVAPQSTGKKSMSVQFNFPSMTWATETVRGPSLSTPLTIGTNQYITLRIHGDPAFAAADYRTFFLYAYDGNGNFGRWGTPVPISTNWQVLNFSVAGIEIPWNSPGLPDLANIVQFAIFQYGSELAIPAYTATIGVDDLMIRDTPLTDPAAVVESVIETFEYAANTNLLAAWKPSLNAVPTLSSSVAATSPGQKSMSVQFNFPSGAWATESVSGPTLTNPVAIATNQYVTLRIKGDPAFAAADYRTFFLYVYDLSGNFGRWGTPVPTNADWQILNFSAASIEQPWNSPGKPDLSKIVRFAVFQYGSEKAIPAYTATIGMDDVMIRNTPLTESPLAPETVLEAFEYETEEALFAVWSSSQNTSMTLSDSVAPKSTGTKSLSLQFNFPSTTWATEIISRQRLGTPIAIGPKQYLTLRLKGDPAFAAADFQALYLNIYDESGNFGRWGTPVPTNADWQIFNFSVGSLEKPWNSPALPDLSKIVRFAFYQYGSEKAIEPYTATILVDDVMIRNAPLIEFPAPAAFRPLLDDFESYADEAALRAFYSYQNSPATTVTTASLDTPAPQGSKALKLALDFAAGQYPWGCVRSGVVAPFSLPTNAVVALRLKGDPALASVADAGTTFWLSFFDTAGRRIDFVTAGAPVVTSQWTTLEARLENFGDTSTVDIGNLVQWRLLVQAYEGVPEQAAMSATLYVDDIRMSILPPVLSIMRDGNSLQLSAARLVLGKVYVLQSSTDLKQWTPGTSVTATSSTATWTVPAAQKLEFLRLAEKAP
jgi:hypothetical protein